MSVGLDVTEKCETPMNILFKKKGLYNTGQIECKVIIIVIKDFRSTNGSECKVIFFVTFLIF